MDARSKIIKNQDNQDFGIVYQAGWFTFSRFYSSVFRSPKPLLFMVLGAKMVVTYLDGEGTSTNSSLPTSWNHATGGFWEGKRTSLWKLIQTQRLGLIFFQASWLGGGEWVGRDEGWVVDPVWYWGSDYIGSPRMVYVPTKWGAKQPKWFMYLVYIRITVRLQTAFVQ